MGITNGLRIPCRETTKDGLYGSFPRSLRKVGGEPGKRTALICTCGLTNRNPARPHDPRLIHLTHSKAETNGFARRRGYEKGLLIFRQAFESQWVISFRVFSGLEPGGLVKEGFPMYPLQEPGLQDPESHDLRRPPPGHGDKTSVLS